MGAFFKKFFSFLAILENTLCTLGLLGTTFMITFQVLNRFWLRLNIRWINDFSLFVFIFFVFFAIVVTTRDDGHTSVDMLVDRVFENMPKGRAIYVLCTRILCIVTIGLFLIPAWDFAVDAYTFPQPGNLVRWFNESWLMESLFVTMCLSFIHLMYNVILGFGKIAGMSRTAESAPLECAAQEKGE
jgi:TRAP-type C4-dicarboxylate transport system permease small subunit